MSSFSSSGWSSAKTFFAATAAGILGLAGTAFMYRKLNERRLLPASIIDIHQRLLTPRSGSAVEDTKDSVKKSKADSKPVVQVPEKPEPPVESEIRTETGTSSTERGGGDAPDVTGVVLQDAVSSKKPLHLSAHEGQGDAGADLQPLNLSESGGRQPPTDSPLQLSVTSSGFEKLAMPEVDSRTSTPPTASDFSMIASLPPSAPFASLGNENRKGGLESDEESIPEEDIRPVDDDDDEAPADYESDFESDDDLASAPPAPADDVTTDVVEK